MQHISRYKELVSYFEKFNIEHNTDNSKIKLNTGKIIFNNVRPKHENTYLPKKINIEIKGGTKVGIIGEIGTGKTSILKILAGLKNYIGEVYIDDYDFKNFHHETITDNIIYISQHPKLFNRTILENISYGTKYTEKETLDLLKKFGIDNFFNKFEKGIYTNVGKEGSKLSGGQKQIMALIRAIIHQKKIILLDEPTSSLDTETKKIFIDLIQTIKDKTIVVVTHDKTIYDLFDDIIELK
jgi:ABC-type bacteriocin/lantibiotic exporter with double-glycine peptidase domain